MRKLTNRDGGSGGARYSSVLRVAGRSALWGAVAVLMIRGTGVLMAAPATTVERVGGGHGDDAVSAAAERFARLYLEDPSPAALAPYLAAGARIGGGIPPSALGAGVAQAEVVATTEVGDGRLVVTVSCELRDSRTLELAVPIVRRGPGEVAVLGAPSIVATPAPAGADPERPRPIAGSEATAIGELARKFLPAYLSAGSSRGLSYLLAPGAEVVPLGGQLELVAVGAVRQLGGGGGSRRDLLVDARLRDGASDATYPVAYRLRVRRSAGRWYVAAVEGAVA